MSVERVFYCDGPECERHVQTRRADPPMFITVTEHVSQDTVLHFCGWDCVLRHAAAKEPETIVSGSNGSD